MGNEKRMIDAERLKETLLKDPTVKRARMEELITRKIDNEPTQPCEPIIYARWERKYEYSDAECSHCGLTPLMTRELEFWTPRCPYCGAHMMGTPKPPIIISFAKEIRADEFRNIADIPVVKQEKTVAVKQDPFIDTIYETQENILVDKETLRAKLESIDVDREGEDNASNDA